MGYGELGGDYMYICTYVYTYIHRYAGVWWCLIVWRRELGGMYVYTC